ncbi:MAG: hypothetical protein RIQ81_1250 [Pseudomonadota bacterium]|jgi:hypothetical protein
MKNSSRHEILLYRIAVSGCFFGHGIMALRNSATFTSQWSGWVQSLWPDSLKYTMSDFFLKLVGTIDLMAGLAVLMPSVPALALYWTIIWGLLTALSRLYFLTEFPPGSWIFPVKALSEFLIRVPNFVVPLVLAGLLGFAGLPARVRAYPKESLVFFAIAALTLGLALHQITDLAHPLFEYELAKFGKPLWYFHASSALNLLAVLSVAILFLRGSEKSFPLSGVSRFLVLAAYAATEGFAIAVTHRPHGWFYVFVKIIEHLPVYLCLRDFFVAKEPSRLIR